MIAQLCAVARRQGYLADNPLLESAPLSRVHVSTIDEVDGAERLRVLQTDTGSEAGFTTNAEEPLAVRQGVTDVGPGDPQYGCICMRSVRCLY